MQNNMSLLQTYIFISHRTTRTFTCKAILAFAANKLSLLYTHWTSQVTIYDNFVPGEKSHEEGWKVSACWYLTWEWHWLVYLSQIATCMGLKLQNKLVSNCQVKSCMKKIVRWAAASIWLGEWHWPVLGLQLLEFGAKVPAGDLKALTKAKLKTLWNRKSRPAEGKIMTKKNVSSYLIQRYEISSLQQQIKDFGLYPKIHLFHHVFG